MRQEALSKNSSDVFPPTKTRPGGSRVNRLSTPKHNENENDMDSSNAQDSDKVVRSSGARWFHLWCLPVLWMIPLASFLAIVWLCNLRGDAAMASAIAALPGLWLTGMFGLHPSEIVAVSTDCVGGVLVMGVVGLFQDMLHVPKRIVILYVAVPLVSFTCLHVLQGASIGERVFTTYLQLLLVHFCAGLYILAGLSCVVYLFLFVGRKLTRTP